MRPRGIDLKTVMDLTFKAHLHRPVHFCPTCSFHDPGSIFSTFGDSGGDAVGYLPAADLTSSPFLFHHHCLNARGFLSTASVHTWFVWNPRTTRARTPATSPSAGPGMRTGSKGIPALKDLLSAEEQPQGQIKGSQKVPIDESLKTKTKPHTCMSNFPAGQERGYCGHRRLDFRLTHGKIPTDLERLAALPTPTPTPTRLPTFLSPGFRSPFPTLPACSPFRTPPVRASGFGVVGHAGTPLACRGGQVWRPCHFSDFARRCLMAVKAYPVAKNAFSPEASSEFPIGGETPETV